MKYTLAKEAGIVTISSIGLGIKNGRPVYTVDGSEKGNMLGLIPLIIHATTEIDAETGELIIKQRPFWSILVVPA